MFPKKTGVLTYLLHSYLNGSVFQVWRLIDGLQLPAIKWGGLVDVVDENRITNFEALSISRGAALVVTCRNADIMLWDSESADGIAGIFGYAPDRQWKSISIKKELKAKFAVQAANDRGEDTQSHKKTVKEQVQMNTCSKSGIKEIQNAKIVRVASSGSSRTGRSHSSSSKSTHKEEKSEKQAVKHSGSAANEDGSQIDGPSVGISAGKILKLPGILKDLPSTRELESAQEYHLIKLQMKSVLHAVKQKIKEASKFGLKQESEAAVAPPTKTQRRAPVAVSTAPFNASNCEIKAQKSLSKIVLPRWTTNVKNSLSQVCLLQEKGHESSFRAVLGHERNPALLILHSEDLVHGKYFWTVQLQTDCRIRVGIISKAATDLPFTFDPEAEEDNEHLSWYLESDCHAAVLKKSAAEEGVRPQEDFNFGKSGDTLTITLDCRAGQLTFETQRGEKTNACSFAPDPELTRFQGPNGHQIVVNTPSMRSTDREDQDDTHDAAPLTVLAPAVSCVHGDNENNNRKLTAFLELAGNVGDALILSNITHKSRVPKVIRKFFKELSDGLNASKIIRPVEASEISYKGGKIQINCRCGGLKQLQESASNVTITWPRTALPGPTRMEIRICPPPANSEEACEARYTAGIDKLNSGRCVGVIVDLRPHGLTFNVPITIKIPHSLMLGSDEVWQNQLEGVQLDQFTPVMGMPNCLFTCVDGKFDKRYGLLTVKSSGIFGLKASSYCVDIVHTKLYCEPSDTFLEKRNRLPPDERGPEINKTMHEVSAENFPELYIDTQKALPMLMKLCGVFCQDDELLDVLQAPIYTIRYRARIIVMSIHQHGYALGVLLSLSKQSHKAAIMRIGTSHSQQDDDGIAPDLFVNTVYKGGPMTLAFALVATAAEGPDSSLVLSHPSHHAQQLAVSVKVRGNQSNLLDQTSDVQLMRLAKNKQLSQHMSLEPFPVLVKKRPPKALFKSVLNTLTSQSAAAAVLAGMVPKEGAKTHDVGDETRHKSVLADLFVIRNPAASLEMREKEYRVLQLLESEGWSIYDLSVPLLEGELVDEIDYSQVHNSKATVVFVDKGMLAEKLEPSLPLSKMWVTALQAHGYDTKNKFGGDNIIVVSLHKIRVGDVVFPADIAAWKGQIGERLKSFRRNLVTWQASDSMAKIHEWLLEKVKAGPHASGQHRDNFFNAEGEYQKKDAPLTPTVKYVCERVFATAREVVVMEGAFDLTTPVKPFFTRHNADLQEFWMSLECEFALDISEQDLQRVQTFSAVSSHGVAVF